MIKHSMFLPRQRADIAYSLCEVTFLSVHCHPCLQFPPVSTVTFLSVYLSPPSPGPSCIHSHVPISVPVTPSPGPSCIHSHIPLGIPVTLVSRSLLYPQSRSYQCTCHPHLQFPPVSTDTFQSVYLSPLSPVSFSIHSHISLSILVTPLFSSLQYPRSHSTQCTCHPHLLYSQSHSSQCTCHPCLQFPPVSTVTFLSVYLPPCLQFPPVSAAS